MDDGTDGRFRQRAGNTDGTASDIFNTSPGFSPPADVQELNQLRRRLREMKELLGEEDVDLQKLSGPKKSCSFLDGNMVSLVFAVAMGLILCVTVYAFQHLYTAVMKRFNPA